MDKIDIVIKPYDLFDRDEDGDDVMGRIEDDDCHNACEEEDGKKEAVEGRGDVVPTERQQHNVDQRCKDSSDSLPTNNSIKQHFDGN